MVKLDREPKSMTCAALCFHHCGLRGKCQVRGAWDACSPCAESLGRQITKNHEWTSQEFTGWTTTCVTVYKCPENLKNGRCLRAGTGEGLVRDAETGLVLERQTWGWQSGGRQGLITDSGAICSDPMSRSDFQVTQNLPLNTGPDTQQLLFYIYWLNAKYCPSGHTFPALGSWIARHQLPEFIFCLEPVHHTHSQPLIKSALDIFLISVLSPWSIVPHFLVMRIFGLCLPILSLAPCLLWKGGPINR